MSNRTLIVGTMLVYCWPSVYDAGPSLNQHWSNFCVYWEHETGQKLSSAVHHATHNALQSQNAVSAHLQSKQMLPFGFTRL